MTTPANTPELAPVNPVVEVVLDEIISEVERTTQLAESGRRIFQAGDRTVTEAQLAEAGRRILQAGDPSTMFAELMKHPVTGEPIDYAESRMFYG